MNVLRKMATNIVKFWCPKRHNDKAPHNLRDWEWIADSGAALPAVGTESYPRIIEHYKHKQVTLRGCTGRSTAHLCKLFTPQGIRIGVFSHGAPPLYPLADLAASGKINWEEGKCQTSINIGDKNKGLKVEMDEKIPLIRTTKEEHPDTNCKSQNQDDQQYTLGHLQNSAPMHSWVPLVSSGIRFVFSTCPTRLAVPENGGLVYLTEQGIDSNPGPTKFTPREINTIKKVTTGVTL